MYYRYRKPICKRFTMIAPNKRTEIRSWEEVEVQESRTEEVKEEFNKKKENKSPVERKIPQKKEGNGMSRHFDIPLSSMW